MGESGMSTVGPTGTGGMKSLMVGEVSLSVHFVETCEVGRMGWDDGWDGWDGWDGRDG